MVLNNPLKSYRIWITPRTGSTLLCDGLQQTGVAGNPGEFFNTESIIQHFTISDLGDLQQKLWKRGTTKNGVFGIKHSYFAQRYKKIYNELAQLVDDDVDISNHEHVWQVLFPNVQHIYLTRRNKVRQAVSWWKAIKTNQWHIKKENSVTTSKEFYNTQYDFAALRHLFEEACLRECAMQEYFTKYEIVPLTIFYEDMIANFQSCIDDILLYLNISSTDCVDVKMNYQQTASQESEIWVERFKNELLSNSDGRIW